MTNQEEFNIEEGSVTFWVDADKVIWSDNKDIPLFEKSTNGSSIYISKDSNNMLSFFHIYSGKGQTNLKYDVSRLPSDQPHFFAFTWNTKDNKKLALYIDGELKAEEPIKY